jgi:hypothetical protein
MTLIVSHFDRNGIVLATDSNLTAGATRFAGVSRKNFELPHLRGGLSVAGCWNVGGIPMNEWMPRFIARPATYASGSLDRFVICLHDALQDEMLPDEKKDGTIIHIAGYVPDPVLGYHPVHWMVSNIPDVDDEGNYRSPVSTFHHHEDFWEKHCRYKDSPTGFPRDAYPGWQVYANGFPPGRIAYMESMFNIQEFLAKLWGGYGKPGWHFRPPKSLEESMKLVRLYMGLIHGLFEVSDAPVLYVGGEVQIIGIPLPTP